MSKDADWILREDEEAVGHVLHVLARRGAHYRFGAPLDVRWLSGGWSAHLEFRTAGLRLRTDFVTRPPRLSDADRDQMWQNADAAGVDVVGLEPLVRMKQTMVEKDYAVIGELARRMDPRGQLLYGRSSRDLIRLAGEYPDLVADLVSDRPLLARIGAGRDALEEALDHERRRLMREDEHACSGFAPPPRRGLARRRRADRRYATRGRPPDRHVARRGSAAARTARRRMPMSDLGDQFLSQEDLDLAALSDEELVAYWNLWLAEAQITNELDAATYSHGVFERDPAVASQREDHGAE